MKKIGDIGIGGSGTGTSGTGGNGDSIKDLLLALREELDELYAKLDADGGVTDTDYADTLPKFEE